MKSLKKNHFLEGIFWNYGSLAIMGISGFAFSIMIIQLYNAEILGVFNQIYAYYLVLSQLTVFGTHMAVGRFVPEYECNQEVCEQIVGSANVLSFCSSAVIGSALFLISVLYHGEWRVLCCIWTIIPALLFFSWNKVFLAYLNGLSKMKMYAVFQSARYLLIAASIIGLALLKIDGNLICLCFSIAEGILFVMAVLYCVIYKFRLFLICKDWIKPIVTFGWNILPSNMVLELNTKIDVICLGLVLQDDYIVGIYSFATLFAECFYQALVVIRRSINPNLTQSYFDKTTKKNYYQIIVDKRKWLVAGACVCAVSLVGAYYVLNLIMKTPEYLTATIPLLIICVSIAWNSKSVILGNLMAQTGFPKEEAKLNLLTAASNFFLNFILIYLWGIYGAAVATAISYCVFAIILNQMIAKNLTGREQSGSEE